MPPPFPAPLPRALPSPRTGVDTELPLLTLPLTLACSRSHPPHSLAAPRSLATRAAIVVRRSSSQPLLCSLSVPIKHITTISSSGRPSGAPSSATQHAVAPPSCHHYRRCHGRMWPVRHELSLANLGPPLSSCGPVMLLLCRCSRSPPELLHGRHMHSPPSRGLVRLSHLEPLCATPRTLACLR
jgi:hypothetical protein